MLIIKSMHLINLHFWTYLVGLERKKIVCLTILKLNALIL